jgi:hypothetical protein
MMPACMPVSLTCISILTHSYITAVNCWCGTFFLNRLEPAGCVHPKLAVYNINLHSIISITGIHKCICFLISYAFLWLSSDQLAIFFSESIYECGGPFRWPWGPGIGRAAVEWYQTEKLVLACYMYLELVQYLVWICLDTEWLLDALNVNEIWKAWNRGSRALN